MIYHSIRNSPVVLLEALFSRICLDLRTRCAVIFIYLFACVDAFFEGLCRSVCAAGIGVCVCVITFVAYITFAVCITELMCVGVCLTKA